MTQPTVAVVIPVGRDDGDLMTQVRSVLAQTVDRPFEVILSVNSPPPHANSRVARIIDELGDHRLRCVDSSTVRGAAHARNAGLAASTADCVAFCDADDRVHDGWLAALMRGLEGCDAVSGRVIDVFPSPRMAHWHPPATPGTLPSFLGTPYLLSGNLAVRRAAFEAVSGFDETLTRCEDIALGWDLIRHGYSLGYVDDAVIDYVHRPGVRAMLRQHYMYGRGMSEVIARHGIPSDSGTTMLRGIKALRPNGQPVSRRTIVGTMRRGAIATGRVRGMIASGTARSDKVGSGS
jgi:cellulose synthase/poly-beta-1,6-N-acetylglucosamine synthase-like glycosyltransferase